MDHTIVTARCGAALAGTSYAFGDAVRRGLPVSYGTDAPVESLDPLRNLYAAVTRRPLSGGAPWQPQQAVTRAQALFCYTQGSAWQEFAEAEKAASPPASSPISRSWTAITSPFPKPTSSPARAGHRHRRAGRVPGIKQQNRRPARSPVFAI